MSNISGFIKRLRDIMRNDAGINGDAQRIEQIAWLLFLKVYDTKEQDWEFEDDKYQSIIPDPCRWRNWAHEDGGKGMTGDALLNFVNNILFPVLKGKDYKDANGNILIKGVQVDPSTPIKKAIVKTTFEDANTYMKDGNPLPTFEGEPERVAIPDDAKAFAEEIWDSLDADNKISLVVCTVELATGAMERIVINKYKKA